LALLKQKGKWTEIVFLILNDNQKKFQQMCKWIVTELGSKVPILFIQFYLEYHLKNLLSTPIKILETTRKITLDIGLYFCYIGNVSAY